MGAARSAAAAFPAPLRACAWPLFAGGCWAAVMALWERDKRVLAPGLVASMDFIYSDEPSAAAGALALAASAALATRAGANGGEAAAAAATAAAAAGRAPPRSFAELLDARAWRAALAQR